MIEVADHRRLKRFDGDAVQVFSGLGQRLAVMQRHLPGTAGLLLDDGCQRIRHGGAGARLAPQGYVPR